MVSRGYYSLTATLRCQKRAFFVSEEFSLPLLDVSPEGAHLFRELPLPMFVSYQVFVVRPCADHAHDSGLIRIPADSQETYETSLDVRKNLGTKGRFRLGRRGTRPEELARP